MDALGGRYVSLWPESRSYGDKEADEAVKWIKTCAANMGNTKVYEPLECILNRHRDKSLGPLNVFLVTDGQVGSQDKVVTLIQKHKQSARVHTVGIGDDVSRQQILAISKASHGECVLASATEYFTVDLIRILRRTSKPALINIVIVWPKHIHVLHQTVPAVIYQDEPFTYFALLQETSLQLNEAQFEIEAYDCSQGVSLKLRADVVNTSPLPGICLYQAAVQQLMHDQSLTTDVEVHMSLTYNVLSKHTAFYAESKAQSQSSQTSLLSIRQLPTLSRVQMSNISSRYRFLQKYYYHGSLFAAPSQPVLLPNAEDTRIPPVISHWKNTSAIPLGTKEAFRTMSHIFHGTKHCRRSQLATETIPAPAQESQQSASSDQPRLQNRSRSRSRPRSRSRSRSRSPSPVSSQSRDPELNVRLALTVEQERAKREGERVEHEHGLDAYQFDEYKPNQQSAAKDIHHVQPSLMHRLIEMQRAQGNWELSEELLPYTIYKGIKEFIQSVPETLRNTQPVERAQSIWATLLVLRLIPKLFSTRMQELELILQKARKWLQDCSVDEEAYATVTASTLRV